MALCPQGDRVAGGQWEEGGGEVISYIKLTHHQTAERRSERVSERERAGVVYVEGAWYMLLSHDAVI